MNLRLTLLWVLVTLFIISPVAIAQEKEVTPPPPDFRPYVFGAYTIAFVLLFAFIAILFARQKALDREIAHLKDRLNK